MEYEIFYDLEEIRGVKDNQRTDAFHDLQVDKMLIYEEADGVENLPTANKFNIMDYVPKEPESEKKNKKQVDKEAQEEEARK